MESSSHTDRVAVLLPLAGALFGVLMMLARQFEPQLKPVVSLLIWLTTTAACFYWLHVEGQLGKVFPKWALVLVGLPLIQLVAIAVHLVRTRPFPTSAGSVMQLLVLAVGYFGFYFVAANVTLKALA